MPTAPPLITPHITPLPSTADRASYGSRGRALFDWEVNTLAPGVNAIAENVHANALEAEESVAAASAITGAAMWVAATNYATGAAAISLVDYQTYRRKTPGGVNATDPSAAPTLWEPVGGKRVVKAGDTGLGTMGFQDGAFIRKDEMRWSAQYKLATFQTSFTNGGTHVGAKPNGTGVASSFNCYNATVSEFASFGINATRVYIEAGKDAGEFGDAYRPIYIRTSDTDRMVFEADGVIKLLGGNAMIGATAYPANVTSGLYVLNGVSAGGFRSHAGTTGAFTADAWNLHWNGSAMALWVNTTSIGNLTITSDYRIKRDVQDMAGDALARLALLRPVSYRHNDAPELNFKAADDDQREGFLAHELAEVVPSAVVGEKDAPDQIQSLRLDPLVALLVKAVQQQQAQIDELTQRLKELP